LQNADVCCGCGGVDSAFRVDEVHVVGISMGGMISEELALYTLENPNPGFTIKSLTLMVTHAGGLLANVHLGAFKMFSSFVGKPRDRLRKIQEMIFTTEWLDSKPHPEDDPNGEHETNRSIQGQIMRRRFKSVKPPTARGILGHFCAVATHRISHARLEKLRDSEIPIQVIGATVDHLVPSRNSKYLADWLQCKEVTFESGHAVNTEAKREVNQAIHLHITESLEQEAKAQL